jgi:hypothetical protein
MEKLPPIKGESGTTGYSGTSGYGHAGSAYTIRVGQSEHTYTWSTSGNMSSSGNMSTSGYGMPIQEKQTIVDITSRGRLSKIKPSKKEPEHFPTEPGRIKKAMTMLQNSLYGALGHRPKKRKLPALSSKLKPIK